MFDATVPLTDISAIDILFSFCEHPKIMTEK